MSDLLHPQVVARFGFLFYRNRFLMVYILIGVTSLCVDFVIFRALTTWGLNTTMALTSSVAAAIFYAYWLNARFNFKIPKAKRNRAFLLFTMIALGSGVLNWLVNSRLQEDFQFSYEFSRTLASGLLFLIAYTLHRKFSFRDFKQVGVAVYANGVEDISGIKDKVGDYPGFIHVDIIDETFGREGVDPKAYRMEAIRAHWPRKEIHLHIMSRLPSKWLEDVMPHVDVVILHVELDEVVEPLLKRIRSAGKHPAICLSMDTSVDSIKPLLPLVDMVMMLTIMKPGASGQKFQADALKKIKELNELPERKRLTLCVDGGVNEANIHLLHVERVVSGSSVLNHPLPQSQIMRLQTSSSYEAI